MDDAYAIVKRWEQAFNEGDADRVAELYAPSAAIWGTLAQYLATSATEIQDYFRDAARAGLRVKLGAYVMLPIAEDGMVVSGHYTLSRPADGQDVAFPARYSFVLVNQTGGWTILHQHSSFMPNEKGGQAAAL
jgi:uncharacterized protein (TIGR02246 family)